MFASLVAGLCTQKAYNVYISLHMYNNTCFLYHIPTYNTRN